MDASDSPSPEVPSIAPPHSVATCPVCEAGLCGIRICTGDDPTTPAPRGGFVMCDECEAVWDQPDTSLQPSYLDPESPQCPICNAGLWNASRWADTNEIRMLGWEDAVMRDLDG